MNIDEEQFREYTVSTIQSVTGLSRVKSLMVYESFKRANTETLIDLMKMWLIGKLDTEKNLADAGKNLGEKICEKYNLK